MSTACGCPPGEDEATPASVPEDHDGHRPWWRDRAILVPLLSGASLLAGHVSSWTGAPGVALPLFWTGLLLGASTFVLGAVRRLITRGTLGIGLLMTISAAGAVILGHVEEAAALAFLYSLAEGLEDRAMDRARSGLRALLTLMPETATVMRDGTATTVPAADLRIGQALLVRPGERVATDGIVRSGHSSLDTSAITGESIPMDVAPGDEIPAGAINASGALEVETTAAGTDNSLTTIVTLVERAQADKGGRARLADRIARPLVPGVIVLAVAVAAVGAITGDPEQWISRALVVLVAASPCAVAIAVPVTVVSAIGSATRFGVVVTSGAAFERLGEVRHVALDKTGTLTRNQPTVTQVVTIDGVDPQDVLAWAAGLEQHSTHPVARAVVSAVTTVRPAQGSTERAGHGIRGSVDGAPVAVGSPRWLETGELTARAEALERAGMTALVVHRNDTVVGLIAVRDELRSEVPSVIETLTGQGVGITMLTGDNQLTARAIAARAGIRDVRAALRPADKAAAVTELRRHASTAMIGDGINDAPALATADVGIAIGTTGSDAAIESADVAFTGRDLRLIPQALAHARRGRRIIDQNVALSLLIIATLPPLAMSGVLGLAAIVLIHEAAEVIVILNGLRAGRTVSAQHVPRTTPGPLPRTRTPS